MHAEVLSWSICVSSLVLIAQVVFLLDTHKLTNAIYHPTHALATADMGNYYLSHILAVLITFSALTLLVGRQEGHPACKKTECWDAGVVVWDEVQTCI